MGYNGKIHSSRYCRRTKNNEKRSRRRSHEIHAIQQKTKILQRNLQKAAARAFNRYYKNKAYKSPKARKAAMTRDMCHNKAAANKRTTSAYRANPGRFDYPGLDDGSNCQGKVYQHVSRDNSANFKG